MTRTPDKSPYGEKTQILWDHRYAISPLFDELQVDEGFYTMTGEWYAHQIASATQGQTVLDASCGLGMMSIAYAEQGFQVTAVDIDPEKIKKARHNAGVYGVADKIEFVCADVSEFAGKFNRKSKAYDNVVLDPPWGTKFGDYKTKKVLCLEDMAMGGKDLRDFVQEIECGRVVMKIPNNFDFSTLERLQRNTQIETYPNGLGRPLFSCLFIDRDEFLSLPRRPEFII
jgi:trimethylguanosine synthase